MTDPKSPSPGGGESSAPPKIIVDSDWKAQAQREKERLAEQEKEAAAAKASARRPMAGAAGSAGTERAPAEGEGEEGPIQPDFLTLVESLATQAIMYLGGFPDPQTGRAIVSLEHAAFNIDLLTVLETKTKGNLTDKETEFLSQVVTELRNRFVEISRAVAQMQAKQAAAAMAGGGTAGAPGAGGFGGMGGVGGEFAGGMQNFKLRQE